MKEFRQERHIDRPPEEVFGWLENVNNLPKYLPPIKEASREGANGDRLWLKGEIPDRGEFENEGYIRTDEGTRTLEWGAEVSRDYSGRLEVHETSDGGSNVEVQLWFGPRTVEGEIQEESSGDRDPLEEGVSATLDSIQSQLEEGAGKQPQPSPEG
ncbi:SRPBCC family protein [Rubrobacter aplysinae]|uniref:SRPBCC family protein n=1 Tax=Rubrobacter aplysinae TaxID=909625 RepID=UPI00064B8EE8|nr:SRPBCC family protein [Rubrobacter aplysinae]